MSCFYFGLCNSFHLLGVALTWKSTEFYIKQYILSQQENFRHLDSESKVSFTPEKEIAVLICFAQDFFQEICFYYFNTNLLQLSYKQTINFDIKSYFSKHKRIPFLGAIFLNFNLIPIC